MSLMCRSIVWTEGGPVQANQRLLQSVLASGVSSLSFRASACILVRSRSATSLYARTYPETEKCQSHPNLSIPARSPSRINPPAESYVSGPPYSSGGTDKGPPYSCCRALESW